MTQQCTAKAKSTGNRCTKRAMKGKTVCRYHGGKSPGKKPKYKENKGFWFRALQPKEKKLARELMAEFSNYPWFNEPGPKQLLRDMIDSQIKAHRMHSPDDDNAVNKEIRLKKHFMDGLAALRATPASQLAPTQIRVEDKIEAWQKKIKKYLKSSSSA